MLLFIVPTTTPDSVFPTISKHLMLLFIINRCLKFLSSKLISKHFMLLFIRDSVSQAHLYTDFKTSHVIVYPSSSVFIVTGVPISKHLMLLFILTACLISLVTTPFQNISCYCLSGLLNRP